MLITKIKITEIKFGEEYHRAKWKMEGDRWKMEGQKFLSTKNRKENYKVELRCAL